MRILTDLPIAIPGSSPPVAVPNTAACDSAPTGDKVLYQPMTAYFTFIQTNLAEITIGSTLHGTREAEQRHLQITNEAIESSRND